MRFADVPKSARPIIRERRTPYIQRVLDKFDSKDGDEGQIIAAWIAFLIVSLIGTIVLVLGAESIISGISDNMTTRACYNNGNTEVVKQIAGMDDGYVVVCQG